MHERIKAGLAVTRLLGGQDAVLPAAKTVAAFAARHGIAPLVTARLPADDAAAKALAKVAATAVYHQLHNEETRDTLCRAFCAAEIPHMVLKGSRIGAFYPSDMVRTSGDVDVYVAKKYQKQAARVMRDLGFEQTAHQDNERGFTKAPHHYVELHETLGGYTGQEQRALNAIVARATEQNGTLVMTDSDVYVYAVWHLYKHLRYAGVGVRLFFDVYCLRALADDTASEALRAMALDGFERYVRHLCEVMFGEAQPTAEDETVLGFVFDGGTFGVREQAAALREVTAVRHPVKRLLYDHCFDLFAMQGRYPVLRRRRWLYPFACVYRVVNGVFRKREVVKETVDKHVDRDTVARVREVLHIVKGG